MTRSAASLFAEVKPDILISTISGGSFETQQHIIDSAVNTGISRFVAPEFGQDSLNEKIQCRVPPSQERAKTIQYLRELAEDHRLSWVAVATGVTLDRGLLSGNLGFDIPWQSATLHGAGNERFAASSSQWLGRVIAAVIDRWEDVQNQYLYVAGILTTANEVVKALEQVTGKRFEIGRANVEECVHEAERRLKQSFPGEWNRTIAAQT